MCNQCSNEGNPLCETCLAEERLTLECQRLAADRDGWKRAAESQNRQWVAKCEEATEARAEVQRLAARVAELEAALECIRDTRNNHDAHGCKTCCLHDCDVSAALETKGAEHD